MPTTTPKAGRIETALRTADALAEATFRATRRWPPHELHSLGSQLCRAALSVACNLVESTSRKSAKERLRFVEIADGSLREAGYALDFARRLGLYSADVEARLSALHAEASSAMARRRASAASTASTSSRRRKRGGRKRKTRRSPGTRSARAGSPAITRPPESAPHGPPSDASPTCARPGDRAQEPTVELRQRCDGASPSLAEEPGIA